MALAVTTTAHAEGVKNQADATQGKDSGAAGLNAAMGAMLIAMCMASQPPQIPLCIMGAMALAQAGADRGHSGAAGATGASAYDGSGFSDSDPTKKGKTTKKGNSGGSGLTAGEQRKLDEAMSVLGENGYKFDPNSGALTGPNGAIPGSAFSSPSSLSEFGFSDDQISQVKTGLEKIKEMSAKYKDVAGGGGGGSGKMPVASPLDLSMFAAQGAKLDGPKGDGSLAGYSRNLAGDPIGVAGDDIFQMVHRRYRAKDRANSFLP